MWWWRNRSIETDSFHIIYLCMYCVPANFELLIYKCIFQIDFVSMFHFPICTFNYTFIFTLFSQPIDTNSIPMRIIYFVVCPSKDSKMEIKINAWNNEQNSIVKCNGTTIIYRVTNENHNKNIFSSLLSSDWFREFIFIFEMSKKNTLFP